MNSKRVLIILAAIATLASFAGNKKEEVRLPWNDSGKIVYQEVVQVEGASKAELYARAKAFIVNAYHSANVVIQQDDPESGRLVAKGVMIVTFPIWGMASNSSIHHTLTIEVKEGRYRYTLGSFYNQGQQPGEEYPIEVWFRHGKPRKGWKHFPEAFSAEIEAFIAGLKAAMLKPSTAEDKSW